MSNGLKIGSTTYRLTTTKPSKTHLNMKRVSDGLVRYGTLTSNRPTTTTLKFTKNGTVLYLNQPNKYLGNYTNTNNYGYDLGGGSRPVNASWQLDNTYTLDSTDQGDVKVLVNVAVNTIVWRYVCNESCSESCHDCPECMGSDRRSAMDTETVTYESMIDEYKDLISDTMDEHIDTYDLDDYEEIIPEEISERTRAVSAVAPPCSDASSGARPNGGYKIYNSGSASYPSPPSIADITESFFEPSSSDKVNFIYNTKVHSITTSWTTIFSYYPYRSRGSCSDLVDSSRISLIYKIRRDGVNIYLRRILDSSIDQGERGLRDQQWRNCVKSSAAVYISY